MVRLAVLAIVIVGIGLRLGGINRHLLWQDEAESAVYALQILQQGYPSSHFEGLPLYENASFIPSPDPKYAYQSTNFVGSHFERNKGWLPFYLIAGSFKLFGVGTWQARLPSLLIAGGTLLLLSVAGKMMMGSAGGLAAAAVHAVNPAAIYFEQQARYFSLSAFLLLAVVVSYAAWRYAGWRYAPWALAAVFVALFYTHFPLFIIAALSLGLALLMTDAHRWREWWLLPVTVAAASMPWLVAVRFWQMPVSWSWPGTWSFRFGIIAISGLLGGVFWGWARVVRDRRFSPIISLAGFPAPVKLVVAAIGIGLVGLTMLVPVEGFTTRHYASLVPLLTLWLIAAFRRWRAQPFVLSSWATPLLVVLLQASFFIGGSATGYGTADWVKDALAYLEGAALRDDTLLLTTYHHFPFWVYSRFRPELVCPLRPSFVNRYPGPVVLFKAPDQISCGVLDERGRLQDDSRWLEIADRIATCPRRQLTSALQVYECPPLVP